MKKRTAILIVFALVFIEQLIKHVIRSHYMEVEFPIIPPLFYFVPKVNTNYSYINDLFNIGLSKGFHIGFQSVALIILVLIVACYRSLIPNQKVIQLGFLIAISGIICVLIDTLFFGGSLDYIYLKPLYIFDLKDLYLNAGAILTLFGLFTMKKEDKDILLAATWRDLFQAIFEKK